MNSNSRIKDKKEFNDIINTGKKNKNSYFILFYKEKKQLNSRFGITTQKKFGNAVSRNKYKRIVREIIRTNKKTFSNEFDYIIIVSKKCESINYNQMKENLINIIK